MRATIAVLALGCVLAACVGRVPGDLPDVELTSAAGLADSHPPDSPGGSQSGANCMGCHSANGDGPGVFAVAATVWTPAGNEIAPLAGALVQLRTEPFGAGDVVVELEADDLGNFYTTVPVDFFAAPLFPHVSHGGATLSMPFPTDSGACNMCHHPGGSLPLVLP